MPWIFRRHRIRAKRTFPADFHPCISSRLDWRLVQTQIQNQNGDGKRRFYFNVDAHWDPDIDDMTLSQICTYMENEHEAFKRIEDLSLSQALDKYEVDMEMDSAEIQQFNFQLTEEPITADNVIQQLEKAATKTNTTNSRYTFSNDSDIENLIRSTESKNTRRNTNWSVTTFNDWRTVRMEQTGCAIPELATFSVVDVNQWSSKFAVETRRKDGKPYSPKTLYMLCVGILRYLRENGNHINFLDEWLCSEII